MNLNVSFERKENGRKKKKKIKIDFLISYPKKVFFFPCYLLITGLTFFIRKCLDAITKNSRLF